MSLTLSGVVRYLWKAPSVLNPFLFLAHLYGPAARCKLNLQNGSVGLALLYPALAWSRSLLAIMDIRARSVSF